MEMTKESKNHSCPSGKSVYMPAHRRYSLCGTLGRTIRKQPDPKWTWRQISPGRAADLYAQCNFFLNRADQLLLYIKGMILTTKDIYIQEYSHYLDSCFRSKALLLDL